MDKTYSLEQIREAAAKNRPTAIYGAGIIGLNIYTALKTAYGLEPKAFLVSEKKKNPAEILGVPVMEPESWRHIADGLILIAAPEEYHEDIVGRLKRCGLNDYICINSELEYAVMSGYFRKTGRFLLLEDREAFNAGAETGADTAVPLFVAMACHEKDRKLKKKYPLPEWIVPIQVGAAAGHCPGMRTDDTGDNISGRNFNYSELTATYWLWKNNDSLYKGVCHYRRYLKLTEGEVNKLVAGDVDAVLPLPFFCYPDAKAQYGRYISEEDSRLLFSVLKELEPAYYNAAQVLLAGPYLYNYNMLIAKREVFDRYCAWMFPLLFAVEEKMKEKGVERKDRYLGYMGEVLTSLYFMKNSDCLHIAHACKIWMV